MVKVRVFRFDPGRDKQGRYDTYNISITLPSNFTIMNLLSYISVNIDPELGYFFHSRCNRGVCKRCLLRVNDEVVLACRTLVEEYVRGVNEDAIITIEPVNKRRVVRDLIVDML